MSKKDEEVHVHISSYTQHALVLIGLLVLTLFTVLVANLDLGAFAYAGALVIASIKVFVVLSYFMHLKYESLFVKLMVGGVFLLFALVIIITFIDYLLR